MQSTEWADPAVVSYRERWRAGSLEDAWLRPSDWFSPAVDTMVAALKTGHDLLESAGQLGAARAEYGVGIRETIDDLAALYRLEDAEPPLDVLRELCDGWASAFGVAPAPTTCMDPESGLPTLEYFSVRLAETYGAAAGGAQAADTHCLVLVDVALTSLTPGDRLARSAAAGRAFEAVLAPGHPAASLGSGVFAVLVERGPQLGDVIARLSHQIGRQAAELGITELMRQPPRIWIEALPAEHLQAVELLSTRRR